MSVVAVRVSEDNITMSADSIIIHGEADKTPIGKGKIFNINEMLIGFSGYASEGLYMSLFAENHTPLAATERDIMQFCIDFSEYKYKLTGNRVIENSYFIAYKSKCFLISGNYIAEIKDYYAIGYGHEYAKAALYLGHSPHDAVKTACALCCYVDEPIITLTLDKKV